MFACDNIPMSSTRKYRQNGVDINRTLLNEKRSIVMKHFEFCYFVSILKAAVTDRSLFTGGGGAPFFGGGSLFFELHFGEGRLKEKFLEGVYDFLRL